MSTIDRRTQRTRRALVDAFVWLVHQRNRFESVRIGDIIERANVGRSTFYEHFKDKNAVLAVAFEPFFLALSGIVDERQDARQLVAMLELCWTQREIGRSLLSQTNRRVMSSVLRKYLLVKLRERDVRSPRKEPCVELAAIAMAEAQLAAIHAWLWGEVVCDVAKVADTLMRITRRSA